MRIFQAESETQLSLQGVDEQNTVLMTNGLYRQSGISRSSRRAASRVSAQIQNERAALAAQEFRSHEVCLRGSDAEVALDGLGWYVKQLLPNDINNALPNDLQDLALAMLSYVEAAKQQHA